MVPNLLSEYYNPFSLPIQLNIYNIIELTTYVMRYAIVSYASSNCSALKIKRFRL